METSNEKQVTIKKENLPSDILFEADAAQGLENVRTENLALPILKLLQNGSGEAQKRNQNYVEGAEPGMFLNTVTKKCYNGADGIEVVPCYYKLEFQEWADFGTGSGRPENIFGHDSDILSKTTKDPGGKDRLENGNYILTVGQHFVLIVDGEITEPALISMSSSQGKVSRKWNSMMASITLEGKNGPFTPAIYSHKYVLSSVLNSGKGNQWYGFNVVRGAIIDNASLYERAKKFHNSFAGK